MLIGPEVIWTVEFSTGLGKLVYVEEAQKDHDQVGCMLRQGEWNQVGYQRQEPSFPYQSVIISNNNVEVSMK